MSSRATPQATDPVDVLKGVGPALSDKLEKLGIRQVQDLLFHLPLRYQNRTHVTPIGAVREGIDVVIQGKITAAQIEGGRRRSLHVRLDDDSGQISLRFFHFSAAQMQYLKDGTKLRCFGQVRLGRTGFELYHPEYVTGAAANKPLAQTLTAIYPAGDKLSQLQWRKLCQSALHYLEHSDFAELIPPHLQAKFDLKGALRYLHNPDANADLAQLSAGLHPAQLRLALEELVAHNLSLQDLRQQTQSHGAPALPHSPELQQQLLNALPFKPTKAQSRVIGEISADLSEPKPMLRLVQGDVGSGKTLVAACAALQALGAGYQVAMMAPTEILSEQHLRNFSQWFEPLGISPAWLTGRQKGRARKDLLEKLASGASRLIIGTHALFQDDVQFANLALVIVDEQHRFGVHQRLALAEKAGLKHGRPHQLIMTATPIPRTLSMVAYADLDCSVIDELPPGRQAIQTALINSDRREQVIERVGKACAQGRQAYWVCTLIEESDVLQAQAAEVTAEQLGQALPDIRVGLIHGRMKAQEKEAVMQSFKDAELDLLVATTVIEVGVDVPNASLMIIENPERLGLAQLHQLRGRVGRGDQASACVLLYQEPLAAHSRDRLHAMRESNDGFYLAEQDLLQRGPGEVLGTRQTGLMDFRIARLPDHNVLLDQVNHIAEQIRRYHPELAAPLIRRWIGDKTQFAVV